MLLLGSCGGSNLDVRLETVHHTYAGIGMVQTGAIDRGELSQGQEVTHVRSLEALRCYQLLALTSSDIRGLELTVHDPEGRPVRTRRTQEGTASLQVCAERAGNYEVFVRSTAGSGDYLFTLWATESSSCGAPLTLDDDDAIEFEGGKQWVVEGTTASSRSQLVGSCISGDAPEQIYVLDVPEPMIMRASLVSEFDGALYLSSSCGDSGSEIACNDDAGDVRHSQLSAALEPGQYFLVVDGYGAEAGNYRLEVNSVPVERVVAECSRSETLTGGTVAVSPGERDLFDASCAPTGGAERMYQINLDRRSRVTLERGGEDVGAVYVRSNCGGDSQELVCGDRRAAAMLDPGTYYVMVEGSGPIDTRIEPIGAASDACGGDVTVNPLALNATTAGSTRAAENIADPSCSAEGGADAVYLLSLERASSVRLFLMSQFDGVLHIRRACLDDSSEVACNDDGPNTRHSTIVRDLTAGDYFVFVDGYGGQRGDFALHVAVSNPNGIPAGQ